jgi:RNA polymerase sigma-70 factor, ECF subfamily
MTDTNATHAVDAIVRQYARQVYNIAYRITADSQDAEDVTQETFLQVHRNLHKFRGESAPYTWIYRIAVNAGLRYRKHVSRTYIEELDATILEFRDDLPDDVRHWRDDPESRHIYEQLLTEVQQACCHFITRSLTDEQRVVYVLRVILGFSLDDIAEILEVEKTTVKGRLQRAKNSLRSYFSGRCQWVDEGGDCSCESRLGFALSAAPEIIQRLRNHPPDKDSQEIVRQTIEEIGGPDSLYSRLPMLDYHVKSLEYYLA